MIFGKMEKMGNIFVSQKPAATPKTNKKQKVNKNDIIAFVHS